LSAAPHLVLLPGLDGTGELFAPLLQALGEDVTTSVVRYGAELTFDEYVESAGKALPEQCVLLAESFSGPIAIAVAARYPGRIRCLVLCATFAVSPFRALLSGVRFVPKRMFRPNLLLPTMVDHFCFSGASVSVRPSPVAVVSSVPPAIMRARLACLGRIDVRALLPRITTPTLYLRGSTDRIVSSRLSLELTSQLPNVTVTVINGPHLLLQARPRECAATIATFIRAGSGQPYTRPVTGGGSGSPSSTDR
jgi:pimeloyl-[acyl-carrier protein] methyl ester esterase